VDHELRNFTVHGQALTSPSVYRVEADASTACYYAGLACALGVELEVANIGSTTIQPDFEFVSILQKFGFHVLVKSDSFRVYGSRPRSNVLVPLKLDMSRCSDQALTVGVMSIITGIPVEVRGVAHIRHHESDRIASFCRNCRSLGIEVDEFPDGFVVRAGIDARLLAGEWPTHNDHRFALSGIVLSAWAHGVRVLNPACMQKTAPSFVKHLQTLGVNFES
jgi:3-phosphoshikimate 1-carboxyvinyltransferase